MKRWMLVKNHDGVGHGVYVRDIPAVLVNAAVETFRDWWDENSGNVFWFAMGISLGLAVMLYE